MMRLTFDYFLLVVSALFALTGCSTLSTHEHHHPRGSLSEVMQKASDDYTGEREVDTSPRHHGGHNHQSPGIILETDAEIQAGMYAVASDAPTPVAMPSSESEHQDETLWFGVRGGVGTVMDQYFEQTRGLDLLLEFSDGPTCSLRLLAGFQILTLRENGNIVREAVEGEPLVFGLGGEYKFYETSRTSFLGLYFLGGIQFDWMVWTYQNAVQVEHEEAITTDSLCGIDFYPCLGARLMQIESIVLNLELRPGIKIWYTETNEGFKNDLFHPTPYLRADVVLAFEMQSSGSE